MALTNTGRRLKNLERETDTLSTLLTQHKETMRGVRDAMNTNIKETKFKAQSAESRAQSAERDAVYAKSFALGAKNKAQGAEDSATDAHRRAANLENQVAQLKDAVIQLADMQQEMDNEAAERDQAPEPEPADYQRDVFAFINDVYNGGRDAERDSELRRAQKYREAGERLKAIGWPELGQAYINDAAKIRAGAMQEEKLSGTYACTIIVDDVEEDDLPDTDTVHEWFIRTFFPDHE